MKEFLDKNFLLQSQTAEKLYHEYARDLPIIDYHCHLPPEDIANNRKFETITQIWLNGDHYKWRAMRANGISEDYCTGNVNDEEKFMKWAETVPYTMRNPLYHWTHLELRRYFNINKLLNPDSAKVIYETCNTLLNTDDFSTQNLLRKMNVEIVCTTDDPLDSLEHHKKISDNNSDIKVLPTFRPDKAMAVENPVTYNQYLNKLGESTELDIISFTELIDALKKRHDFFTGMGCKLSDHGIDTFYAENFTVDEISKIFRKIRSGKTPDQYETQKYKSALLLELAIMNHENGWTQQFHYGALRNNNSMMLNRTGPDNGFDSIGDEPVARSMSLFLDRLAARKKLTKTIIYNLNPKDNELVASMTGNFQDGTIPGKIQFGSGWWFLDQKNGIEQQLNSLSNMGLLSRFVGMLTDSRSFLSYPRHEYFRRVLCNLIGEDVEKGELPQDMEFLGKIVQDVCYYNASNYFKF
ncbi:MAG: glucuronate isomerase [Bacteroidetes bacterium]|nr:glucuronate isomerase [Bacteroidota bacterium]